jgi:hypothetical protein
MKNQSTRSETPANGSRISESAATISDETKEKASTFAHDLADRFEDFLAGTRFKRTYDQIETFATARPMLAVAIGVLAGAIFGRRIIRLVF